MPTALELSREEWRRYIKASVRRSRFQPLEHEDPQALERLLARVEKAAALLKTKFRVRRVLLFGSLAHRSWFFPDSDVDLAVEGLAPEDYWRAWRMVEEVIGDRHVDLIEVEESSESLRQAVEKYGVEL